MSWDRISTWFAEGDREAVQETVGFRAQLWSICDQKPQEAQSFTPTDTLFVCAHLAGRMKWYARFPGRIVERPVTPGTFCISLPGETGHLQWREARATVMHFHLQRDYIASLLVGDDLDPFSLEFVDPANTPDLEMDRIARLAAAAMRDSLAPRLRIDTVGLSLVSHLVERWSSGSMRRNGRCKTIGADWRLRRAMEYLDAKLSDDVALAELARVVGLTTTHLNTLFRAGTGEPPHRWLMQRRIERAREMLLDPRHSVTEVAMACGFASSQHLATAFRRRIGVTPSQYRRERIH